MPRPNSCWFRSATNSWYTTIDGKKVPLGVRGRANRTAALVAFAEVLAGRSPDRLPSGHAVVGAVRVRELGERFLAAARLRLKPATVARYENDVRSLAGRFGAERADRITGDDLALWAAGLRVCDTSKSIMLRSASAMFGWAVKARLVRENPARGVPRPKCRARAGESVVGADDVARLLAAATPQFQCVLRVLHATGCRPGEVEKITAETLDAANGVAVIRDHKTDRTGRPRLIFFPPDVATELGKLAARCGSGPLLRSRKGVPWTARSILQAMKQCSRRAGVGVIAYHFRHTFATDALAAGCPEAHVAELLGHSGTAMLHKHYAHLGTKAAALRAALGKVRGKHCDPRRDCEVSRIRLDHLDHQTSASPA